VGCTIAVTAGGTREFLDPVRYLGNRATGMQGVALARAALERGASVRLVLGSATAVPPYGVDTTLATTAREMQDALRSVTEGCDALVMNAAVGDFRPAATAASKIKRREGVPRIEFVENPSLLGSLEGDFVRVAFAAETDNHEANARAKLDELRLDAIVVNDISAPDRGFAAPTNAVTMLTRAGDKQEVALQSKDGIARAVLDLVQELLKSR
jgi:phosphopantothenoylcysteine decarboxylase/phosphopantothenate--cysteine ligase